MPGTVGALFGSLCLILTPTHYVFISFIILFTVGTLACELYRLQSEDCLDRDPKFIVIDEVCGIFLGGAILGLFNHASIPNFMLNFILFRFFDILKPFPIKNVEDRLKENVKTASLGIMLDDVLAAIYAIFIQIICITIYTVLC
jgi:phosphatidylglycerophosphatase A